MYENGKMRPVETVPRVVGEEIKENDGGGLIELGYIIKTFINVTMYPLYNNKKKKEPTTCQVLV
jgi:hypothetical protein